MGFCYNCGAQVGESWDYCAVCGASLKDSVSGKPDTAPKAGKRVAEGYIMTNIKALASKLRVSADVLLGLIDGYRAVRRRAAMNYELIDVSDYRPRLSVNRGWFSSAVKLSPSDGWEKHQSVLSDRYAYDVSRGANPEYLFIIGDDDIIPFPAIGHHSSDGSPILSDIPYSHLYGGRTKEMIESSMIFQQPQSLMAARLPLAEDAGIETLHTYLENAARLSEYGVDFRGVYAQSDPHWKAVTGEITKEMREKGWMTDYGPGISYKSVILTPPVTKDMTDVTVALTGSVFPVDRSFYLFNMHGGKSPVDPDYAGQEELPDDGSGRYKGRFINGATPAYFKVIEELNVVFAECCYGAKVVRRKTLESILMSALSTKTVLFFASTHVAMGTIDKFLSSRGLSHADNIVRSAMLAMAYGYTAGQALWVAKSSLFEKQSLTPSTVTTALEFNLFGDPSLIFADELPGAKSAPDRQWAKSSGCGDNRRLSKLPVDARPEFSTIYSRQRGAPLLDQVRQAVNQSLSDSTRLINEQLYERYGISPRNLDKVLKCTCPGQDTLYEYQYISEDGRIIVAVVDKGNNIVNMTVSK